MITEKGLGCAQCLHAEDRFVQGKGNPRAKVLLVGEAPGWEENRDGVCFVGRSGQELDMYLSRIGLDLDDVYVTNTARCYPGRNKKPSAQAQSCCRPYLNAEIQEMRPDLIVTLGAVATEALLGDWCTITTYHGVPFLKVFEDRACQKPSGDSPTTFPGGILPMFGVGVVPIHHPAYALRSTTEMYAIIEDFKLVRSILDGAEVVWGKPPEASEAPCVLVTTAGEVDRYFAEAQGLVAVDTESTNDGKPWSVQFSVDGKVGCVVLVGAPEALSALKHHLSNPDLLTIFHNAAYDYRVLQSLGIVPANFTDTMLMSNLIQTLPRGLKPLAGRLCGLLMHDYEGLVAPFGRQMQVPYLEAVVAREWPDLPSVTKVVKGVRKSKKVTNIAKRAQRILADCAKIATTDPYRRWHSIDEEEGRGMVEEELGPMPTADIGMVPLEEAVKYAGTDAVATYRIYPYLKDKIEQLGLSEAVNLDLGIVPMLADMSSIGIKLDTTRIGAIEATLTEELTSITGELERIADRPINPSSSQDIAQFLYERGIFRSPKTSTKAETLLALRDSYGEVDLILKHREAKKLLSTYAITLPKRMNAQGRVRTDWSQITAITGRLASKNPNLQNIPSRTKAGKAIRHAFVPEVGCSFLSADYSQIEPRFTAHWSEDPLLIKWYQEDRDVYAYLASEVFGVPVAQVDKKTQRDPMKIVFLAILYGLSMDRLARKLKWTIPQCEEMVQRALFGKFPSLKKMIASCHAEARMRLQIRDHVGRRRVIAEVASSDDRIAASGYRMAVNTKHQQAAGSVLKKAMADLTPIYKAWQEEGFVCRPILQIHDEVVLEVSDEILEPVAAMVKEAMEHCVKLRVPLKVETSIAKDWGSLK